MSNLVIVAIPRDDDYVWKISSEKVPHMTLLFLGDVLTNPKVSKIQDFLEHAVTTTLKPFEMSVDHRGTLGVDLADVLFFDIKRRWTFGAINDFRAQLLQDNNIRTAFDKADQFDAWQPHLTLGYPATPAKPDDRDYPGTRWVDFDRIALWVGDFEGPTFQIPQPDWYDDICMSTSIDEVLAHHGIKGQRWGVRRKNIGSATEVTVSVDKGKLKTSGGENQPAHADAVKKAITKQTIKKSGVDAVSNKELEQLATRLNLEKRVSELNKPEASNPASKFIKELVSNTAKQQIKQVVNDQAAKSVKKALLRGATAGAVG